MGWIKAWIYRFRMARLKHVVRLLPGGGIVLVLDTGTLIPAEAEAMLQALHSRSLGGVFEHLQTLALRGFKKFMETFYVGYGHKSIGDCGTGTIFIEGVSMLVAKAIQDWMLYSGQEASTRFIDFSEQPFINPFATVGGHYILEQWRQYYLSAQEPVRQHLLAQFPRAHGENELVYKKAINARCFDILRGFLPAGASTKLSWHTNLRQAADHLTQLRHHPLQEVRDVANVIDSALVEMYPSSFGHKRYDATERYYEEWMHQHYYLTNAEDWHTTSVIARNRPVAMVRETFDEDLLAEYGDLLNTRPPKTELPKPIAECGTMQFEFSIDFGSFRDIQRHRAVIQRMPLLSSRFGMHPWYFESLPSAEAESAERLVRRQLRELDRTDCFPQDNFSRQYYLPMGMCAPCRLTGDLPALVYLVELRAQTTVHPTLHDVALQMADHLQKRLSTFGLRLYVDRDHGRFDIRRGTHDIVQK